MDYQYFACIEALLIVPYGIKTAFSRTENRAAHLLIVPYGIET